MSLLFVVQKHTRDFFRRSLDYLYPRLYRQMPGLTLKDKVRFWGKPIIDIQQGGKIDIGAGVRLFSTNFGTHVNYATPTKLVADRPGATIVIGENCTLAGVCIHAYESIRIGSHCVLGVNTNIVDCLGHPTFLGAGQRRTNHSDESRMIVIEDDVWIPMNCVVLPGTHIGSRTVVAPNSVVSGNIPPDSLVAGNPAKVVPGYYSQNHEAESDGGSLPVGRSSAVGTADFVKEKIAEVLRVDRERIQDSTTAQDIEQWDSMGTMSLLAMLAETFGVSLGPNETQKLQSVAGIVSVLENRKTDV
jgi:acetyltransferase-like isoleucine patch superfamily enzyme/acyl carrier protein